MRILKFYYILFYAIFCFCPARAEQLKYADGFASMSESGLEGTTGGKGGEIVTVSNYQDLVFYVNQEDAYIIIVNDTINFSGMLKVKSNKSIIGFKSHGVISGGGFNLSNVSNIIIQNLLFQNSNDDAINIQSESHHIWINHCDLTHANDGLIDIKRGSDFITVSWNTFYNHDKNCLLGHDDTNGDQDIGHLRVTYHHNWFNYSITRNPRVRFSALCHVYNNYYTSNNYGIASTMDAQVLVENNYFHEVSKPTLVGLEASAEGDLVETGNIFLNCGNPPQTRGQVDNPPYLYLLDNVQVIPDLVKNNAGRQGYNNPELEDNHWTVYTADVLPNENIPPFLPVNSTNPPDTTSWIVPDDDLLTNKLLQFSNPLLETSKFMWGLNWNMNPETGATIAFRMKPLDPVLYNRTFEVEFRDGKLRERLIILPDSTVELDRADVNKKLPYRIKGWHTFRITYQNGMSVVYLDENPIPFLSGTSQSENSSNDVRFGDGSDLNACGFLLDWFVWDVSGAFTPWEKSLPVQLIVDSDEHSVYVEKTTELAINYILEQNYPNPFNPETIISFILPRTNVTSIKVFNSLGQCVNVIYSGLLTSGYHQYVFKSNSLPSGIYFYQLETSELKITRKMLLIK